MYPGWPISNGQARAGCKALIWLFVPDARSGSIGVWDGRLEGAEGAWIEQGVKSRKGSSGVFVVCWLVAVRPSNMLVYLRDGSAQTIVLAAKMRQHLQIKISISSSHSILTLG